MTADIDKLFNETAQAYSQEVEINLHRKYLDIFFGAHAPIEKVLGVSSQLLNSYKSAGAKTMHELAKRLATASLPSADSIYVIEYWERLRDAFRREGLTALPELGVSMKPRSLW